MQVWMQYTFGTFDDFSHFALFIVYRVNDSAQTDSNCILGSDYGIQQGFLVSIHLFPIEYD